LIGRFYTQSTLNNKHLPDNAFADDTLSFAADHSTLQEKANIVSAFSIVFGTDLRADKLRVAHYSYGSEDHSNHPPEDLTVHTQDATHRWHPNPVPIRTEGDLPHLGVLICPNGVFQTQYDKTEAAMKTELAMISTRRCSTAIKIAAIRICSTPRATYAPAFCNWELSHYQQLQIPFNQAFKRSARLMQSHPNYLLYAPVSSGGLGLTALSDICQATKAGHLHRSLQADPDTAHAAQSILARAVRSSGAIPSLFEPAKIHPPDPGCPPRWLDSYITHLAQAGPSLQKGGFEPTNTLDLNLQRVFATVNHVLHQDDLNKLFTLGITTLGDIATHNALSGTWHISAFGLKHFPALNHFRFPRRLTYTQILRPGLCYSTRRTFLAEHAGAFEILGTVDSGDIAIRLWSKSTRTTRFRRRPNPLRLQLHPTSFSKGSATDLIYPYPLLFPVTNPYVLHIVLSEDLHSPQGTERTILSELISTPPLLPTRQLAMLSSTPDEWACAIQAITSNYGPHSKLYTDGSWKLTLSLLDAVFRTTDSATVRATAAIVLKNSDPAWRANVIASSRAVTR
jgi:hypothetical protein